MDFQPEEVKKQQSINTSFIKYTHNKHTITLMDTPGDQNFFSAAKTCFPVADCMAFVIDGVGGPSAMTEEAAASAIEYNLPGIVIVNKLDRGAFRLHDLHRGLQHLAEKENYPHLLSHRSGERFQGVCQYHFRRSL